MTRQTYRLELSYDGRRFWGFCNQPGRRTVESVLLDVLNPHLGFDREHSCSKLGVGGRTDRGVSADCQVVSFYGYRPLPMARVIQELSVAAPGEMQVHRLSPAPREFHASFSAIGREYRYELADPEERYDAKRLDQMLQQLVGRRCFNAFCRGVPTGKSTIRQLISCSVGRRDGRVIFRLEATAFLRRQVRVMVATALRDLHQPEDWLLHLAETGDRSLTAPPAPVDVSRGVGPSDPTQDLGALTLVRVRYAPQIESVSATY